MEGVRRGRAVRVHVADEIGERCQPEPFDERAALADRLWKFQRPDRWIFRPNAAYHTDGIIGAAVEHDHQLELAVVMFLEVVSVVPQHRFNAALFIVGRDQEQQAWLGHADYLPENGKKATGVC